MVGFADDLPSSPERCPDCHTELDKRGRSYYCPRCDERKDPDSEGGSKVNPDLERPISDMDEE